MSTTVTQTITGWKHTDDTLCDHPDLCRLTRDIYFAGGRPEHPDNLSE